MGIILSKPCRVMGLSQTVALVMVNKCMKFHKICLNTFKVIAKVKVFCKTSTKNNDYVAAARTRVMTIPRLLFL